MPEANAVQTQNVHGAMTATQLFSRATALFNGGDSDGWTFCYTSKSEHLCTIAYLTHGRQIYRDAGEEFDRGTPTDDFILLSVDGKLRKAIVEAPSSIDDFLRNVGVPTEAPDSMGVSLVKAPYAMDVFLRMYPQVHYPKVTIGYVIPNPSWFERMMTLYPQYISVIVSVHSGTFLQKPQQGTQILQEMRVAEVIVNPSDLAGELSLMARHVLGIPEGRFLGKALSDYVTGYLAPRFESLQKHTRR